MRFLAAFPAYHGLSLDFESLPDEAMPAYTAFIHELYARSARAQPAALCHDCRGTDDTTLKAIAANSDGIVLMNYDEHEATSDPGPIASQNWFVGQPARACSSPCPRKS